MRELLDKIGWSNRHFAKVMGVDERTISRWLDTEPVAAMKYLQLVNRLIGE